jgi:hypothetical protein
MLPGSLVGLLTGYATVRYGRTPGAEVPSRSGAKQWLGD